MQQQDQRYSSYSNEDLAPVPTSERKWGVWNFIALWVSMSICIPTYPRPRKAPSFRAEI